MSDADARLLPEAETILTIEQRFPFLPQLGCYALSGVVGGVGLVMTILLGTLLWILNNRVVALPPDCYRAFYVNATNDGFLVLPSHCSADNISIPGRDRVVIGSGLCLALLITYVLGLCLYILMAEVPCYRARILALEGLVRRSMTNDTL